MWKTRTAAAARARPALTVETLPDRLAPAALINGVLILSGTNAADVATVDYDGTAYRVVENGRAQTFAAAAVTSGQVVFHGNDGNDRFTNSTWLRATADGGTGQDVLTGGPNGDWLYGGDGDDTIFGGAGTDWIAGENGADALYGQAGNDRILGASFLGPAEVNGNDRLYGGDGTDELYGGDGDDTVAGGNGGDALFGDRGNDALYGAFVGNPAEVDGNDRLDGGDGNDALSGGDGNDVMAGQNGDDELFGGRGDDRLLGATFGSGDEVGGNDALYGGDGRDELRGGVGNDTLSGGNGNDGLFGEWGNDLIYGGAGDDQAFGGDQHDSILGQDGRDRLDGEGGNDAVYGGNGDDLVSGGQGNDICYGGDGADRVWGNDGDDLVAGGYVKFDPVQGFFRGTVSDWNQDFLSGGAGRDTFVRGDKKFPFVWLDHVGDKESGEKVEQYGWDLWGFQSPETFVKWGHLYTEVIG